ncbi:MAG: PSD1 domain-containing protein, partial [Planctomycetes bacterium]|nr:PSD1 domain-containing protein [Planctomycetota bacterium]
MTGRFSAIALRTLSLLLVSSLLRSADAQEVRFARDIQPLLAKRCFACHGPAEHEGGVAFHRRDQALAKSENGHFPIVPGKPEKSALLRRVTSADESERMPPEGPPLTKEEISLLRRWIDAGAKYEKHWAFVAPQKRKPRPVSKEFAETARNEIDRYILARLQAEGLSPSPEASRAKLIRRLFIDLTGLLPSEKELKQFLGNRSEAAYEKLVDRLLASEHFGERWGRHWLDLARYADSFGYERDDVRPNAWRYRDWVIQSINRNQPFDQFVIDQLAGDLVENPNRDQQIATGLHRMNIKNNESGINKEDYRNREIVDRVNTTSTAMLGLTIGCAQCHSHKYDPFSQTEYYQFYAFFNNSGEKNIDIEGTTEEQARYRKAKAGYDAHVKRLESRKALLESMQKHKTPAAWLKSVAEKSPESMLAVFDISAELKAALGDLEAEAPGRKEAVEFWATLEEQLDDTRKAQRQLSVESRHLPKPYIMTLAESTKDRRATHVLLRGDFKQKGDTVAAATPATLNPFNKRGNTGDRLDLARWIAGPQNPLTARVAVNRIWMHLFGSGLVSTPDDFGTQGNPPSHPDLLDWLAVEFMESGWNRKKLIRTIVLSATYRQDSIVRREDSKTASIDPENRLLWRQSRFRVEAEVVRDLFLSASGLLHRKTGGPTIHPAVPSAVSDFAYKYKTRWVTS